MSQGWGKYRKPDPQQAALLPAMLTHLFFRICFWKEPPGYLAVTVAAVVLAATGRLVYLIFQGPSGGEDQVPLSAFRLLLWCSYGAILWTLYT